MTRCLFY